MDPIGLALGFAFFWVLAGAGLFLVIWTLIRVAGTNTSVGLVAGSGNRLRGRDLAFASIVLPLAAIFIYIGLTASYKIIFR